MLLDATEEIRSIILQDDGPFVVTLSAPTYAEKGKTHSGRDKSATVKLLKPWIELPAAPRKMVLHNLHSPDQVSLECFTQKQHFTAHVELKEAAALESLVDAVFSTYFLQVHLQTPAGDINLRQYPREGGKPPKLVMKKGKASRKQWETQGRDVKHHPITAGNSVDLLKKLGIADERGRIIDSKRAKFRQINQFITIALTLDLFTSPPRDRALRIIDCGCGKAYLSLALYHYLQQERGLNVELIGIDSNPRVINFANTTAQSLGMKRAQFIHADISEAQTPDTCDLLIALHACDTATDEALALALRIQATAILAAPCCHHYVNDRLKRTEGPPAMAALVRDNIGRERLADLLTDSMRRDILQSRGYRAGLMEFVAPEHTTRNIMIRAEYRGTPGDESELQASYEQWGVAPFLAELIRE